MVIGIVSGTAFAMFEGAVIAVIREQSADYGLQRAYGAIGGMISSPLSGLLIDYASKGKDYTDFRYSRFQSRQKGRNKRGVSMVFKLHPLPFE